MEVVRPQNVVVTGDNLQNVVTIDCDNRKVIAGDATTLPLEVQLWLSAPINCGLANPVDINALWALFVDSERVA